jgi:hypothetical protein
LLEHLQERMATIGNYPDPMRALLEDCRTHKVGLEQGLFQRSSMLLHAGARVSDSPSPSLTRILRIRRRLPFCKPSLSFFPEKEIHDALSQKTDFAGLETQ